MIARITGYEFELNSKFFSLTELSREYEISDITSRRVIAELCEMGYIDSIPGKGSYIRSRLSEKNIILFSARISEINDGETLPQVHSEIYKGILMECGRSHADLQVLSAEYIKRWPKDKMLLLLLPGEVIIKDRELAKVLRRSNCKKVFCHSAEAIKNEVSARIPYTKGISLAAEHLIERGHKRIAFLTSFLSMRTMALRFEGYCETLKKYNIALDLDLVHELPSPDMESDAKAVRSLLKLKEPPTAIITANNTRALNVLEFCNSNGIKVPEQLAIAAFDNIPESMLATPKLTVVNTFWDKIGAESVRLLLEMAESNKSNFNDVIVEPELIIREST